MIPFSHTGIQNIRKMGDEAFQEACGFQNLLVIQPAEKDDEHAAESIFRTREAATLPDNLAGFGLAVECALGRESIGFRIGFDSSIMIPEQADRLLHQFEHVIRELLYADLPATAKVADVDMFSAADGQALMAQNGVASMPRAVDCCMHHIVAEQAARTPHAPAIQSRDVSISFVDLEDLTTDLAHRLQALGVGPERIVPLCLEKSVNGIIAMLAVQKAGGAFVPLNPADPFDRLRDLVDQVDAKVLVFSEQTKNLLPDIAAGKEVVVLPTKLSGWTRPLNTAPVVSDVQPSNLAYTLFTSGSTGRPKAVMVPHRSLSSSTSHHGPVFGFADYPRRVLQFATYTFDVCIGEIFTTLIHGGCVCVPSEHDRMNNIAGFIRDLKCDVVSFTPTFARLLKPSDIPSVRTLILGGEALPKECVDVWGDQCQLINGYGPTECCTVCVIRRVPGPRQPSRHKPEAIGTPVGILGWVVDAKDHGKLVPAGCVGELVAQGPCVARGYLKNPEKTAEAFVDAPAWLANYGYTDPNEKLYKTGDLVRMDVLDGTLTYLGRKDNQTKVNGQRLELGEIEERLKQQKGLKVEAAVVLAGKTQLERKSADVGRLYRVFPRRRELQEGRRRIWWRSTGPARRCRRPAARHPAGARKQSARGAAQVHGALAVGAADSDADADERQDGPQDAGGPYLASWMPTAWPCTGWLSLSPTARADNDRPPTDTEKTIIDLVARAVGRDAATIRPRDNFLRLGGDSIVAIQLVAALNTEAGLVLTSEEIFRQPTIHDMAAQRAVGGRREGGKRHGPRATCRS